MCVDERSVHRCFMKFAFIYTSTAFQKKTLALGLVTSIIAKSKHAREFVEKIALTRLSLVPRVCVHVRTILEELSGIVNSPVLFDVFKHKLRP